jgi:hypothetical protein
MMTFPLPLEKPQYEMFIFGSGYKRRFTIAHELAHVVLNNQFLAEKERLTNNVEENVCDIAASMILLPDVKLVAAFANTKNVKLNISLLEDLSKKLEVSLTVMVNRIRETSRTRSIQLLNCAFIVDLAKSRKTSENLAPRVQASCLPIGWYMPNNKRLSSLEMQFLPNLFYQTTLYEKRQIYDHIRIWNQNSRCWSKIEGLVSLKCYITENKTRIMLATIDSQSFDVSL